MGELRSTGDNPEIAAVEEKAKPEAVTPKEDDKKKLVPKEKELTPEECNSSVNNGNRGSNHPKLDTQRINSDEEKDTKNNKDAVEKNEIGSRDVSDASAMLKDPDLFKEYRPGEYQYGSTKYGKEAWGSLHLSEESSRDNAAQRNVGGIDRRQDDDGGHLIAARFGGSGGNENLEPQNRNLNRGDYKRLENKWADSLSNGDKVFVYSSSYKPEGSDRPEAFIGYSITEHPDGSREYEPFHCLNESRPDQEAWAKEGNELNSYQLPKVKIREDLPEDAYNENGGLRWNSPFDGKAEVGTLEPGTYLRYGDLDGSFITKVPDDVDIYSDTDPLGKEYFDNLQTPYEYDKNNWTILDVNEPIEDVKMGNVASQEQFGNPEGTEKAWQAQLPQGIDRYKSIDIHVPYWNDTTI